MKKLNKWNIAALSFFGIIAGLILWMTLELGKGVVPAFEEQTEEWIIVVMEKHEEQSGINCTHVGPITTCEPTYTYYINDTKAKKSVYDTVQIGAEYVCKLWSGRIEECQNAL